MNGGQAVDNSERGPHTAYQTRIDRRQSACWLSVYEWSLTQPCTYVYDTAVERYTRARARAKALCIFRLGTHVSGEAIHHATHAQRREHVNARRASLLVRRMRNAMMLRVVNNSAAS